MPLLTEVFKVREAANSSGKKFSFDFDVAGDTDPDGKEAEKKLKSLPAVKRSGARTTVKVIPNGPGGGNPNIQVDTDDPDAADSVEVWCNDEGITWSDENGDVHDVDDPGSATQHVFDNPRRSRPGYKDDDEVEDF